MTGTTYPNRGKQRVKEKEIGVSDIMKNPIGARNPVVLWNVVTVVKCFGNVVCTDVYSMFDDGLGFN